MGLDPFDDSALEVARTLARSASASTCVLSKLLLIALLLVLDLVEVSNLIPKRMV